MKILQIEDYFHPDAGYQVNILSKYLVKAGHEVVIFAAEMDKVPDNLTVFFGKTDIEQKDRDYEKKFNVKIERFPLIGYVSNRYIYTKQIFKRIKELHPDVLFVHGNDSYIGIRILMRPKSWGCPVISDSHMLKMATVSKLHGAFRFFYRTFVTPKIVKNRITVIRTQDDNYVKECLGIPLEQCPYIPLGSDVLLFHKDSDVRQSFRKENNIPENAFVVVYAGKLDPAKGVDLLIEAIKEKIEIREVEFIIVGNAQGTLSDKIEKQFLESKNRVIRFPTQKYNDLAKYYQASDIAVFPKQCSLSFYDVQACGLPVISEDNNINLERNSHNNGICFPCNRADCFREAIIKMALLDRNEYTKMSDNSINYILKFFNYEDTAKRYIEELMKTAQLVDNYR